jgi:putative phosphoribosyl transferase
MISHEKHSFFRAARAEEQPVVIEAAGVRLQGSLVVPPAAAGLVIFAHGSGSGRLSPRNRFVAGQLNARGLATLLLDLLEAREEGDRRKVFDIALLAGRLAAATAWAAREPLVRGLPVCYFGASTGAAVALREAARPETHVAAVVSRGGRPDLAREALARVTAPVLLIVGGHDPDVLALNEEAATHLRCEHRLEVVPGATHLFEEAGALERVALLAAEWFARHLPHPEIPGVASAAKEVP